MRALASTFACWREVEAIAKPEPIDPEAAVFKSTRAAASSDLTGYSAGHSNSGFTLVSDRMIVCCKFVQCQVPQSEPRQQNLVHQQAVRDLESCMLPVCPEELRERRRHFHGRY